MEPQVSRTIKIKEFFEAHPNEWIPSIQLEPHGGRCAWRTRVSEVRRQHGMTIENKVKKWTDGVQTFTFSVYRYTP